MAREASADDDPRWLAVVFGDRVGLAVFLAAALFLGLTWRVGFFIVDSRTVVNLVANVADGRLAVVEAPYSLTIEAQPGLVEVGGRLFGRNYGQAYLAVPFVWLFRAFEKVLALRIALAGIWSLGLVALGWTAATVLERDWLADVGAVLGLAAVGLAALSRTQIERVDDPAALLGLQVTTILVAAAGAMVLYRLLSADRRIGVAAGLGLVVATPIGFWGTIPKRHVFSGTLLLVVCLCFAASRSRSGRSATLARGGTYAAVALLASIHAFEAAFAFAVLVPFDLASHRSARVREHALVLVVFLVAASPMLATNFAISGDPVGAPRTLQSASGDAASIGLGQAGDASSRSTGAGGGSGGSSPGPLGTILAAIAWVGGSMIDSLLAGIRDLFRPQALYHIGIRSGWIPGVRYAVNGWETVELALLEAFPLAGALLAAPVVAATGVRNRLVGHVPSPDWRLVDGLALALAVVFVVVYLPYLPLFSMITLRYLLPAMALLLYLCCRLPPVRSAVSNAPLAVLWTYLGTLLVGGMGFPLALVALDPAVGEAVQLHGLLGLFAAVLVGVAAVTWTRHRRNRAMAVLLGTAGGITTLFLLSAAFWQFPYGPPALDVARLAAGLLPPIG